MDYQVAVNIPLLNSIYTYESDIEYKKGTLVEVPLGKRKEWGIILDLATSAPEGIKLKKIISKLEYDIVLDELELKLYEWIAKYYFYSLGKLIFDSLPKMLKRPQKFDPIIGNSNFFNYELSEEQQITADAILSLTDSGFTKHLIHGVTGSGKSIIFLKLIFELIKKNRSVLFLLPEINLTPQFIELFSKNLNIPIHLYHSALSNSERYNLYKHLKEDPTPKLILGVRSSIFLSIKNLGLIIIDEEHDSSFKQDDRCPYHAKDVAYKKAQLLNIPIVLGSATPSLESYFSYTDKKDKHFYYPLTKRAKESTLPKIEFIDMRDEQNEISIKDKNLIWPFHPNSILKIKEKLARGEQALIFVNRLGFSNFVQCRSCGHQFFCPNCSVTLKYFKGKNRLVCQHCEYQEIYPSMCPKCQCTTLLQLGFGTERVLEILNLALPDFKFERFDRDEISNLKILNDKLSRFEKKEIDAFVGTQMLSKGHNFKRVNLVVILGIDSQLNFCDFRSNEKVYQLLTQVSGRAGRYETKGEVLVQTLNPQHHLFLKVKNHEFDTFYKEELRIRKDCSCSPFIRMSMIYFTAKELTQVQTDALKATELLNTLINKQFTSSKVLGPRPATIEKKSNQFTWCLMLKSKNHIELHDILLNFDRLFIGSKSTHIKIDIDPQMIS